MIEHQGDSDQHDPHDQHDPPEQPGRPRRERTPLYVGGAAILAAAVALGGVALGHFDGNGSAVRTHRRAQLVSSTNRVVAPGATITVTGSGSVQGTPDTVSFSIGVQSTALTANGALVDNNTRTADLEATLERSGVTKTGMQTSDLNIWPNYDNHGNLTGFSVDDTLNVTMHDLTKAGGAIEAGAQAVGNGIQLNGVSFSISNQSALLAAARAKAMKNAATEAAQVAGGAGLALGGVKKVTDQENSAAPVVYGPNQAVGFAASSARVPIEAGRQPVSVQVTVIYLLRSPR